MNSACQIEHSRRVTLFPGEGAGMSTQRQAVTGQMLIVGVVKEQRRARGDVLKSTSSVYLAANDCVG